MLKAGWPQTHSNPFATASQVLGSGRADQITLLQKLSDCPMLMTVMLMGNVPNFNGSSSYQGLGGSCGG